VDWLAHGLPREGKTVSIPYAGERVDQDPPTCSLATPLSEISDRLAGSAYGYALVLNEHRIVLGRVRKSAIARSEKTARAESVMEPGPKTVRPNIPAQALAERLAEQRLKTAIVTTPHGCLIGVFHRELGVNRGRGR
jgi:Mg/Co/Ni transporter MgtE